MFPRLEFRTSRDVNRQNLYVSFHLLVVSLIDTLNVKVLFLRTNFKIYIKIPPGSWELLARRGHVGCARGSQGLLGGVDRSPGWVQLLLGAAGSHPKEPAGEV